MGDLFEDAHGGEPATTGGRRVLLLGDSWVHGLGSERRKSWGILVSQQLHASEFLNLSKISRTTPDVVRCHLDEIADFQPDVALLSIGGAEALVFPAWPIQRLIDRYAPPDWHGIEGMQPPVKYSRDKSRHRRERLEWLAKVCIKQFVINVFGGRTRVSFADFETAARTVLARLTEIGSVIVLIGFSRVDGWSSPKTSKNLATTNRILASLCKDFPAATYVETDHLLEHWGDYLTDKVHLNAEGHRKVSVGVVQSMRQAGPPWSDLLAVPASQ